MEQKKILLVAISVGIFLVIVIGAALMVFRSHNASSPALASARPGTSGIFVTPPVPPFSGAGQLAQPSNAGQTSPSGSEAGSGTPETNNPPLVAENPSDNAPLAGDVPGKSAAPSETSGSSTVISVSRPTTAAVPDAPPVNRAAARTPAKSADPAPSSPSNPPRTSPSPAVVRQTVPKIHNDYWVQTGSFTAMTRAEGVKESLSARGITSIIENRDVNGTTYFRVRVGPYTSQNEADYWLSLIKSINGFETSQVFQSPSIN